MEPITLAFAVAALWQFAVVPAVEAMKPPTELVCAPRGEELVCRYQPVKAPDQVAQAGE